MFEMYKQLCRAAVGMGAQPGAENLKITQRGEEETHKTKVWVPSGNEHKTGTTQHLVWMWCSGTGFGGEQGSAGLMAGFHDFRGLFQH